MAGARTSFLRGILFAWGALFMLATYCSTYIIQRVQMNFLLKSPSLPMDEALVWRMWTISNVIPTIMLLLIGAAMFWMGLHLFKRSESLKKAIFRALGFAVISSMVLILISIFYTWRMYQPVFFFSINWLLLVFPPVLAMYTVLLYDRRHKAPAG